MKWSLTLGNQTYCDTHTQVGVEKANRKDGIDDDGGPSNNHLPYNKKKYVYPLEMIKYYTIYFKNGWEKIFY